MPNVSECICAAMREKVGGIVGSSELPVRCDGFSRVRDVIENIY